jgi:hypothetical protein
MRRLRDRYWPPSRIGLRLLAFNLLVVFVPVVGVLYLDVYEARLLQAQEREMVQQARILAAAAAANGTLRADDLDRILVRLERQSEARFRVYDASGALLADSARITSPAPAAPPETYASSPGGVSQSIRSRLLYRVGAWIVAVRQRLGAILRGLTSDDLRPSVESDDAGLTSEIRAALDGRYGAATRHTPGAAVAHAVQRRPDPR